MNSIPFPLPEQFDLLRLEKLIELWENPGETASSLFIAMNLMDFRTRVKRRFDAGQYNSSEGKNSTESILELAGELIHKDKRIHDLVLTNISFELFQMNLQLFNEEYRSGRLIEPELGEVVFDIVSHYLSLEMVMETLEDLLKVPEKLIELATKFRSSFSTSVADNPDLAEAVRRFAEGAPGGSEIEPWATLLASAPDRVFDLLFINSLTEYNNADFSGRIIREEFAIHPDVKFAAHDDLYGVPEKTKVIVKKNDLEVSFIQISDILCIDITGPDLGILPEPFVTCVGEHVKIERWHVKNLDVMRFRMGKHTEFRDKTVEIEFPGLDIDTVAMVIS